MNYFVKVPWIILLLLSYVDRTQGSTAIKLKGVLDTQIHYTRTQPPVSEKCEFEVTLGGADFLISYTDVQGRRVQIGAEKGDFYMSEYAAGAGGYERGYVSSGKFPGAASKNIAQLIWLGLCSEHFFEVENKDVIQKMPLRIFFASRDMNPSEAIVTNDYSGTKPRQIKFYFPGTYQKQGKTVHLAPPYDAGFLVGQFIAGPPTPFENVFRPAEFEFFHYVPANEPKDREDVSLFEHFQFRIMSSHVIENASFLPEIFTKNMPVSDFRFTRPDGAPVGYSIVDQKWIRRETKEFFALASAARDNEGAKLDGVPHRQNSKRTAPNRYPVVICLTAMFLITGVIVVRFIGSNKAKKTE